MRPSLLRSIVCVGVLAFVSCNSGRWIDTMFPCEPTEKVDSDMLSLVRGFCIQGGWKSKEKLRCEKGKLQILCE